MNTKRMCKICEIEEPVFERHNLFNTIILRCDNCQEFNDIVGNKEFSLRIRRLCEEFLEYCLKIPNGETRRAIKNEIIDEILVAQKKLDDIENEKERLLKIKKDKKEKKIVKKLNKLIKK